MYNHGLEAGGELLVSSGDRSAALEPADAPLDRVAAAVLLA